MHRRRSFHFGLTVVGCVLLLNGAGTAFAQNGEQDASPAATGETSASAGRTGDLLTTAGKLKLQVEGYRGIGLDSSKVGVTTEGDDVKISGGGGAGLGVTLGYGLSRHFDIEGTFGVQGSGLSRHFDIKDTFGVPGSGLWPEVKNADGFFSRSFLLATAKYKVPFRENLQWKFGLGVGYYTAGKLDIEIDPGAPGAGRTIVDYKNAGGVHATGELEILLQERLILSVGVKYYTVTYKAEEATVNGASLPVSSLNDEVRNFNGDGVDITAGLGILF